MHFRTAEKAGEQITVSLRSMKRLKNRIVSFSMNGHVSVVRIKDIDQYHLLLYIIMIFPKVTADEIMRFVLDNKNINPAINLVLTTKRSSTTAYHALEPNNVYRCFLFWNNAP